jgi:hypothetical protein
VKIPRGLFSKSIKRVNGETVHSRAGVTTPMKTVNRVIKARRGREKDDYGAGNKNIIA